MKIDIPFDLDRRSLLARTFLLIGAASIPSEAVFAAKMAKAPRFLPAAQFQLLGTVADTILPETDTPGALAAGVPARLDAMLANWASANTRKGVSGALDRINAAAMTAKKKAFVALTPTERAAVLATHDVAALKPVPRPANAPKESLFLAAPYVADQGYLTLKDLVINLYYYSEIAASKELIYEHVPGKFEPSIKLTPASRPYLGLGPF
jgi:gluconate 2-dehydrogenase gamma chain